MYIYIVLTTKLREIGFISYCSQRLD